MDQSKQKKLLTLIANIPTLFISWNNPCDRRISLAYRLHDFTYWIENHSSSTCIHTDTAGLTQGWAVLRWLVRQNMSLEKPVGFLKKGRLSIRQPMQSTPPAVVWHQRAHELEGDRGNCPFCAMVKPVLHTYPNECSVWRANTMLPTKNAIIFI